MSVETLAGLCVTYGYWLLFAVILADGAGLPLAGELVLVAAGALAQAGELALGPALLVAAPAAAAGHGLGYWAGRLGGDRALPSTFRWAPGPLILVFSRFLVGARLVLAPLAGRARMPFATFVLLDGVGAALWAAAFLLTGYGGLAWLPAILPLGIVLLLVGALCLTRGRPPLAGAPAKGGRR